MVMKIVAAECIACGDCLPECPTNSITEKSSIYKINKETCNECEGEYDEPKCVELCPVENCIIQLAA
jgi:Fe-S-cluster-containing hydrogenase component 2